MGFVLIAILNWQQFLALFGLGHEPARFNITLRSGPPSWTCVIIMMGLVLLFEVLPYLEELLRGLRRLSVMGRLQTGLWLVRELGTDAPGTLFARRLSKQIKLASSIFLRTLGVPCALVWVSMPVRSPALFSLT